MFKDKLNQFNIATDLEDKAILGVELLRETDMIVSLNALCQFDNEIWANENNALKKYLQYKIRTEPIYQGVDCDVSFLAILMYMILNPKLKSDDIKNQYNSSIKFEIISNSKRYKGDTLTSALYMLKLYLGCLWNKIDNNKQLLHINNYKAFYDLFKQTSRNGLLISPTGNWEQYCYDNSDIIWNAIDKEVKEFFCAYFKFGNYMCIPGNSYKREDGKYTSFNMARSNGGKWDTVDALLGKIYAYYKYRDSKYLSAIFTDEKAKITAETKEWLDGFDGWRDFIEKNELSAFVTKHSFAPISMKTGRKIKIKDIISYNPTPTTYKEFLKFFKQTSKRISTRSEIIYNKISLKK